MCLRSSLSVSQRRRAAQQSPPASGSPSLSNSISSSSSDDDCNSPKSVSFGGDATTTVSYIPKKTTRSLYGSKNRSQSQNASSKADQYMNANRTMYVRYGTLLAIVFVWTMVGSIASSFHRQQSNIQPFQASSSMVNVDTNRAAMRRRLTEIVIEGDDAVTTEKVVGESAVQLPQQKEDVVTHFVPSFEEELSVVEVVQAKLEPVVEQKVVVEDVVAEATPSKIEVVEEVSAEATPSKIEVVEEVFAEATPSKIEVEQVSDVVEDIQIVESAAIEVVESPVVQDVVEVAVTSRRLSEVDTPASNEYSIPTMFENDREVFGYDNHWERASFPRWDLFPESDDDKISLKEMKESYKTSIMDSLLNFVGEQSDYLNTYDYSIKDTDQKEYFELLKTIGYRNKVHTSDHADSKTPNYWQPEALYVVDGEQGVVMTSALTKEISNTDGYASTYKYSPTERSMSIGLNILLNKDGNDQLQDKIVTSWPRLHQIIVEEKSSFPFLAHYSDFVGCNYKNWNDGKESLPLFTVAASVQCNHTFPFPTYELSFGARYYPDAWYSDMKKWSDKYGAWTDKINQVVWRGSLTGKMPEEVAERGPRWHLTKKVHDVSQITEEQQKMFDVKLTYITEYAQSEWIKADELGGTSESHNMNMEDFQKYKAIVDVDGHSWSARFAQLLCYSSVILKVEPKYVDYFYYPANSSDVHVPKPWTHFIPIKFDLSDLEEKAAYVLDPANGDHIQSIIHNANEWCANKFTLQSLGMDVLDIWEKYVTLLDQSTELKNIMSSERLEEGQVQRRELESPYENENWLTQWNQKRNEVYNGILQMAPANPAW